MSRGPLTDVESLCREKDEALEVYVIGGSQWWLNVHQELSTLVDVLDDLRAFAALQQQRAEQWRAGAPIDAQQHGWRRESDPVASRMALVSECLHSARDYTEDVEDEFGFRAAMSCAEYVESDKDDWCRALLRAGLLARYERTGGPIPAHLQVLVRWRERKHFEGAMS